MLRFVILLHDCPPDYERPTHFDLMLEAGNTLRTWAIEREPTAGEVVAAEALPAHRLAYLEYEGELSGNRGSVSQWDHGTFEWLADTADEIRVELSGQRLRGELRLTLDAPAAQRWCVVFLSN